MNLSRLMTRTISRNFLIFKKQSPHILFVAGAVGSVVGTVMACRATLKLSDTLDEIQTDVNVIHNMKPQIQHTLTDTHGVAHVYTSKQYNKEIVYVYTRAGYKIVRLYAPAVIVSVASIGALTGSHIQLTKRNAVLMSAYAAMKAAYEDYRQRIREELGEDRELELYHGVNAESLKKEFAKDEKVKLTDPNKLSVYSRFFDEYSKHWEKDPEFNRLFVQCQQNYANNLLHSRGHLFLNEVYDMLGLDRSRVGSVVGWVISKDGDNFVDFGIFEPPNSGFVSGWERSILLDFNVDGVIYDKI